MFGPSLLVCFLVVLAIPSSRAYFVTIEAHAEECFFDKVRQNVDTDQNLKIVFDSIEFIFFFLKSVAVITSHDSMINY